MAHSLPPPAFAAALALLVLSACAKSHDGPAQTYTVDLNPPLTVGQKFSVVTDLSNTMHTRMSFTIPGAPTPQDQEQDTERAAHIEADGEILAVFPNGSPQKVSLTLTALTAVENKAPVPNLPAAGAKVVLEKIGVSLAVTVNGRPADNAVATILRDALETGDEKLTNQTMFGPRAPVAVGGAWAVDSAAIIAAFQEGKGDAGAVTGMMKLDTVTGTGADQVATVSGLVKMEGYKPPPSTEVTIDGSAYSLQVSGTIPAAAKGTKTLTISTTMKLDAHGDQQGVQRKISTNFIQKKSSVIAFH